MLVSSFKRTLPANILFLIILTVALQLICFFAPNNFSAIEANGPIGKIIQNINNISHIITGVIFTLLLALSMISVSYINKNNSLISKTSLLPPTIFVLLMPFTILNIAVPVLLLFLICIHRIFTLITKENTPETIFLSTGTLFSIAMLIDIKATIIGIIIIFSTIITKHFKFRHILLFLTGLLLPFFIWLIILFMQNNLVEIIDYLSGLKFNFAIFKAKLSITKLIYVIFISIISIISITFAYNSFHEMNENSRIKFNILTAIIIFLLITSYISNDPIFHITLSFGALSILLAYVLDNIKSIYADIVFVIIFLSPILLLF